MLLYKYLTKQFFLTFLFSLCALATIFVIINLIENLDDFIDNNATTEVIFRYYVYFLPEVIKLITPVAVLVGILFSIGRFSSLNEITAMKSGGFSLYQLIIPFFVIGFCTSLLQIYFNGWIVPKANEKKFLIEQRYLKKELESTSVYNFYFRDSPLRNVSLQFYDPTELRGQFIFIEEYDTQFSPRVRKRIEAKRFRWDEKLSEWIFYNALVRDFSNGTINVRETDSLRVPLNITHRQLLRLQRKIEEMTFDELKEYLSLLERGGKNIRKQIIKYYGGYAFPFASLIVVLFAVPFASVKQRGGIALQIAAAMTVSFLYLFFTEIGQVIVYTTSFHPAIGGWLANALFAIFGIVIIFRTRK